MPLRQSLKIPHNDPRLDTNEVRRACAFHKTQPWVGLWSGPGTDATSWLLALADEIDRLRSQRNALFAQIQEQEAHVQDQNQS